MSVSDRNERSRVLLVSLGEGNNEQRALPRIFTSARSSFLVGPRSSDDRALWCKCNPDTDMGISRVASEIQIYSAVYSASLIEMRVCGLAFARWLVVHPAECETPQVVEITSVP